MSNPEVSSNYTTPAPQVGSRAFFRGSFPGLYLLLVLAVGLGTLAWSIRHDGIFACPASGYESGRYLAYCQADRYSDYDHGAFWFGLEPGAIDAARSAQVLFLGNSRMQFGLSTPSTARWFSVAGASYYLLGFSYNGNYLFEAPLLQKLSPAARVYVVNMDLFFEDAETPPAKTVLHDPGAPARYAQKRQWQPIHRLLCTTVSSLCDQGVAFFRSPARGDWVRVGGEFTPEPVAYSATVDSAEVTAYAAAGSAFFGRLPVPRECVLLTYVPNLDLKRNSTGIATAEAVAQRLGLTWIAPRLDGLETFDRSHLDTASADRWSAAFMDAAGPAIRKCLAMEPAPR